MGFMKTVSNILYLKSLALEVKIKVTHNVMLGNFHTLKGGIIRKQNNAITQFFTKVL